MITWLIDFSLRDRFLVLLSALLLASAGIWAYLSVPLDAIPDLSDVQVIVFTEYPGQSPQVVEDQVTYPLTTAMLAVPKSKVVRAYSFFGISFVYIVFEDGTDMYWARSRVLESLNYVSGRLPPGISPVLGPDATGVGWIFEYALVDKTGRYDLAELRSIQDWYLRFPLQTVPGVSEVASVGGFVKQYQVEVDPNALMAFNILLADLKRAIQRSNSDVGGRMIEMSETEYMVRGLGYIRSIDDLKAIAVGVDTSGTPIRLQDVARVHIGPELRRGVVDLDGKGEVAAGVIIMRSGENALATIEGVRKKLDELSAGLPEGVEIVTVYDRGDLIERAVSSLTTSLFYEMAIVSLVIVAFLLHVRSAMVAVLTLPLGILLAFIVMSWQGLNANIMSLGGIAITIGAMVDGAIVMIENAHRRLAEAREDKGKTLSRQEHWHIIGVSSREVGPALFFSLLVITVAFIPVFSMQAQEGRMFSPLAFTASYAMAAAAILSITLVPVLLGYFVKGNITGEHANPLSRVLHAIHKPSLGIAMKWPSLTLLIAAAVVAATYVPFSNLGNEFMPPLDEGDILYMPSTLPGISITKSKELLQQTDRILYSFPEVLRVFGKVGRVESATDSAPISMLETTLRLKPKREWPDPQKTTRELMREMDKALVFPGVSNAWTMPIKTRIDMLSTGIKTPVGIKISGPDLNILQGLSVKIEGAIKSIPETLSAFGDRAVGGYYLDFDIDRDKAARYGLSVGDIQDVIQSAIGGMNVTHTVEGRERYPINVRYPRDLRDSPETLKRVLVATPDGLQIPLEAVADLSFRRGPPVIKSENARPNAWVYVDLKTDDIGGFVAKAKKVLAEQVEIPAGYNLLWSGQFEYMQRAEARLRILVPVTLLIIFLLLHFNFRNVIEPVIVMLSIPFGLIGGIWLVYLLGYNMSVAVAVGFIALAGMAAEIGVLVLSFIDTEIANLRALGNGVSNSVLSKSQIRNAVQAATGRRVRPVAMTGISTMAGLIPIMLSTSTGSDVTHRIAAPMLGGMLTVLILNLLVLPVIYSLVLEFKESRAVAEQQ
ncbi:MAG: CusA/CzcA family heavy metal efflux RND transporter [Pseudomonadales bacterium]|nr:CusA/CzcA family heavy metal efflux RND transporter [Pseudomonadales bacterium]